MEKYTYSNIQPVRTDRPSMEESQKALTNFLRFWYSDGRMKEDFIPGMECSGYRYLVGFDPLMPIEDAYSIVMAAIAEIFPEKEETV